MPYPIVSLGVPWTMMTYGVFFWVYLKLVPRTKKTYPRTKKTYPRTKKTYPRTKKTYPRYTLWDGTLLFVIV